MPTHSSRYPSSSLRISPFQHVKVESDATEAPTSPQKAKAKAKAEGKAKEIKQALGIPHPALLHWRETDDAIRETRGRIPAPVDTMGYDSPVEGDGSSCVSLPPPRKVPPTLTTNITFVTE